MDELAPQFAALNGAMDNTGELKPLHHVATLQIKPLIDPAEVSANRSGRCSPISFSDPSRRVTTNGQADQFELPASESYAVNSHKRSPAIR
jgi:hypothetical protein